MKTPPKRIRLHPEIYYINIKINNIQLKQIEEAITRIDEIFLNESDRERLSNCIRDLNRLMKFVKEKNYKINF